MFAEYSALRTDLFSGLLDAFVYNQSQGNRALNAFEIERSILSQDEDQLTLKEILLQELWAVISPLMGYVG